MEVAEAIGSLVVSWLALDDADGYQVQWKSGEEAYGDADRQHDVTGGPTTTYTIQGLMPGTEYTVRVKATRIHAIQDGAPSEEHRGTPRARGVSVTEELPDRGLAVGDSVRVDVAPNFRAPEGGSIEFDAESADAAVLVVDVQGSLLTMRGMGHGVTAVTVTATDHRGAQATLTFGVAVGHEVSFAETVLAVPEGDIARLSVAISRVREVPTTLDYTIGVDADPTTPDADALDRDGARGSVTIGAGDLEAMLEIAVHDDADIEPARETFAVTLEQSSEQIGDFALGSATAWVQIAEGVCDRTAQVSDALRGSAPCTAVSDENLAGRRALNLAGQDIAALRGRDLFGLTGLRALNLSENRLRTLPGRRVRGSRIASRTAVAGQPRRALQVDGGVAAHRRGNHGAWPGDRGDATGGGCAVRHVDACVGGQRDAVGKRADHPGGRDAQQRGHGDGYGHGCGRDDA